MTVIDTKAKDLFRRTIERDLARIGTEAVKARPDGPDHVYIGDKEDGVRVPYSHVYLVFEELKSCKSESGDDAAWFALAGVVKALEDLEDAGEVAL